MLKRYTIIKEKIQKRRDCGYATRSGNPDNKKLDTTEVCWNLGISEPIYCR